MEIMATTTNNHNQKELRLYAPNEQQQTANSTTTLANGGAISPFQREVREWQRIDPDTGALLTGRLEADRWINGPLNKYGKISDSQNIAQPNGTQQTQRKQLEVLQTCTANGAMQVIRSRTVQTTSSRWSTSSASPTLLSASTSPMPQQLQQTIKDNNKHSYKQDTHNNHTTNKIKTNYTNNSHSNPASTPFTTTTLLTNGFNHKSHHLDQLQQYPHSLANGISRRNRNWPDLTENMSTLDICDNDHDNEHDHDSNYIVQHQSSDEQTSDDNDDDHDDDSLIANNNKHNHDDDEHDDDDDDAQQHHHQFLLNKRNNLKNVNPTKRHTFMVFANNDSNISTIINTGNHYEPIHHHNDHDSHTNQQQCNLNHNNNLSRDSSSGSCNNNNQLFLLDTAPSLKLSNLMKSSSSLSNSSNNSTTASQATTNPTSMNAHKNLATNKISLHAIVGSSNSSNNNNNVSNTKTVTTTSSTPSPTFSTSTTRPSWQQPSLYRQISHNNHNNNNNPHLMKSRVGDINNCCSSNSGDESRSYAGITKPDLCHLQPQSSNQQQQQQQIQFKQNDRVTPTHSTHSYHRVDLESFRHYNSNDNTRNNNNDTDDDGLRLSSRHLRRQQVPNESVINSLHRSRSISTDDLSTDWDIQAGDDEEPSEWRRVSKLRRSFQLSSTNHQSTSSPTTTRRPLDLPTNSVSVSKIRAELENGRRLNTVMRNNHIDLTALSSILNDNKETKSPLTTKRDSFLTAESLKEIRGKLKKLSDESLYKEDFLMNQQYNDSNLEVEHIVTDQTKLKQNYERSPERYRLSNKEQEVSNKHTTNSLESRLKNRDTTSTDWHLRRKSYGFEKMSPPEKAMLRIDASTDSGLGRSGELQNLSPTTEAASANRTVVHFGATGKITSTPNVQRRYKTQNSYEEIENSPEDDLQVSKRHSIAVDESQYVRDSSRQTTQIHLNGFCEPTSYTKSIHCSESTTASDRGQQKRVEFSKTEVHFATESGRVNIVETDSKPPPTNNFRRRRSRSSSVGPLQSLVKSAVVASTANTVITSPSALSMGVTIPVTLFGDDNLKKKSIVSTTVAQYAPLVGSPEPKGSGINVTVTIPSINESFAYGESSRNSYASTSGVDTTDCDTDEMTSLRGILKNKPAKPKPYVLGENIDKPDELWGVQLKPVNNHPAKSERVFKSESPPPFAQKSVAERIQELGSSSTVSQSTNSFSTKINVSLGNSVSLNNKNWEDTGLTPMKNRRPMLQEMLMHDLKEHQKVLDEGLKSTTLIIRTMRSATEFDEAMRRLSMTSMETAMAKPPPLMKSNSYQDSTQSLEYLQPKFHEINNIHKSTSFSSTSSWSTTASSYKYSQDSRKTSTDSGASFTRADPLPRLSFLGNEQLPVSQQLQRLRLIYDAATMSQDEDSADEEVKRYFKEQNESDSGGGTQDSSSYEDDLYLEQSNSWTRLKAKKTIWKIEPDKNIERNLNITLDKTELPKSNVMSIKLHSPQSENDIQPPPRLVPPIAKPRTITTIQESQPTKQQTTTSAQKPSFQTILPTKDSLKIIKGARGARQLREHELSYFGVPLSTSEDEKPKPKYASSSSLRNSPKRSLPIRKAREENPCSLITKPREKWQLDNDKPDLLKHNPIEIKPAARTRIIKKVELDEDEEHLYENIANDITPVFKVKAITQQDQYDRKADLKRDAMILSEMNENADQTLRELSDEAALKDRRRRSLQRRNSKPLATIDEKSIAERINETRNTYASEAKKNSRHSTPSPTITDSNTRERTSSTSSVECCPRARSRSLSSEKEYDAAKSKPSRIIQMVKHKPQKPSKNRSSSMDSQQSANSHYSSADEQQRKRTTSSFKREDRSRTKTKRITSSISSATRNKQRDDKTLRQSSQQQEQNHHNHHDDMKRLSSTTHSSSHRERVECKHDNATGAEMNQQQKQHNKTYAGLQRSSATTATGRHQNDDLRDSQRIKRSLATTSGPSTSERNDKHGGAYNKHAIRSNRNENYSSRHLLSHCLERDDKQKDKSSRSAKGQPSRLTTSHHHHERSTNSDSIYLSRRDAKTKTVNSENTTSSKNNLHHYQHSQQLTKERLERAHHKSERDEDPAEHVHGLKSAIIKTTTKLRVRKEKK